MTDEMANLREVAEAGDIDGFYALLLQNPSILEAYDEIQFVDTPLHLAAAAGHTQFAIEMLNLKPSFGRKLNQRGFNPLHMAIRHRHFETAKRLIETDQQLIRVKGREGKTPLHWAAETGDANLVAEILFANPASITDVTTRKQTAIHIDVEKGNLQALSVLLGWLRRTDDETVLGLKDNGGNTVYHIAASTNQLQMMALLLMPLKLNLKKFLFPFRGYCKHFNEINVEGLTALDIACGLPSGSNEHIIDILVQAGGLRASTISPPPTSLADFICSPLQPHENYLKLELMSSEDRNALLVIAVLIITITYQGILSPPGGLTQASDNTSTSVGQNNVTSSLTSNITHHEKTPSSLEAGLAVMQPEGVFTQFLCFNSVAFGFSVLAVITRLNFPKILLNVSLVTLGVAYSLGMRVISQPRSGKADWIWTVAWIFLCFYLGFLTTFAQLPKFLFIKARPSQSDRLRLQRQRQILCRTKTDGL